MGVIYFSSTFSKSIFGEINAEFTVAETSMRREILFISAGLNIIEEFNFNGNLWSVIIQY